MLNMLSLKQELILNHLAKFTFLTTSQLIRLWISLHKSSISRILTSLKDPNRAFIGEVQFPFVPAMWRLENFYYLTKKWKELLLRSNQDNNNVKTPGWKKVFFTKDYFHKKYTIDCHISCYLESQCGEFEIREYSRYFDRFKWRTSQSKISIGDETIVADSLLYLNQKETSRIFALEYYNDKNTLRILNSIRKHFKWIRLWSVGNNFWLSKWHRLLAIFKDAWTIQHVKSRLELWEFGNYVLVKSYDEILNWFYKWRKNFWWGNISLF